MPMVTGVNPGMGRLGAIWGDRRNPELAKSVPTRTTCQSRREGGR
jgi:hypothetical protein